MELKSKEIEKKLNRKDFFEEIKKANSEEYETEWTAKGRIGKQKKKSEIKKGRVRKSSGARFELKVRGDLEIKGWVVDKWSNNVVDGNIVPCRRKFNPFNKVMTIGTGFPDFVCFSRRENDLFKVIGVEVKMNGNLSRVEKEKCVWYLERGIFSEILVASKKKEGRRVVVEYADVGEILERMRAS